MIDPPANWSGSHTYGALRLHRPESVEQVQALVARARKLRVLGTRHSFNDIADSPEDLVSLERLPPVRQLDRERRTVTVDAGVRYGQLCQTLDRDGYALHNLASLPHISVAGACATATHGSGDDNRILAAAVSAMEVVTGEGEVTVFSRERDGDAFYGAVVGLGGIGVVTRLTLDVSPAFEMRQDLYENLALSQLAEHFDALTSKAYSVSLFTDWRGPTFNQVWLKHALTAGAAFEPEPALFGAARAAAPLHPIPGLSAENCTEQMGRAGPWHERLPHFRMAFTPSSGEELQAEYLVPRPHTLAALQAVDRLRDQIAPLLHISEVRTIAADEFWMSPCYRQACTAIHFTWKKDWPAVQRLLPRIEAALEPFDARPHWGKLFTMPPSRLQPLYEKLPDFRRLLGRYDPLGKFRNAFLDRYIFGE